MSKLAVAVKSMSSREIAELCGKRHDNVMTDIRKMLSDLNLNAPDFSGTYKTDKDETYFKIAQDRIAAI